MKKKANPKKNKRIRIAVVGSSSVTEKQAATSAAYLLPHLYLRYEITVVATVKEDIVGKAFRRIARQMGIKLKTHSVKKHIGQSEPLELATAGLIWEAKRFVAIIGPGRIEGCAKYAMEMVGRHPNQRKIKILELKD